MHRFSAACGTSRVECSLADRVVTLQLEVELDNLAQLEAFSAQIPPQAHKAWSQRAQVCLAKLFFNCYSKRFCQSLRAFRSNMPAFGSKTAALASC